MTDTTGTGDLVKRLDEAVKHLQDYNYGKHLVAVIEARDALEAAEREHDELFQKALGISAERDQLADALEAAAREQGDIHKLLQNEQFYTGHSPSTRKAFALADLRIRELEAALARYARGTMSDEPVHLGLLDDMDHEAKINSDLEYRESELRIHALGAAISRRDWHAVEQAHAAIRDKFYSHSKKDPGVSDDQR